MFHSGNFFGVGGFGGDSTGTKCSLFRRMFFVGVSITKDLGPSASLTTVPG